MIISYFKLLDVRLTNHHFYISSKLCEFCFNVSKSSRNLKNYIKFLPKVCLGILDGVPRYIVLWGRHEVPLLMSMSFEIKIKSYW
jgi:hypothetical protein